VPWVKLSDDFGERAARTGLSDAAFRTHIEALLWTMRRETGGWIHSRDIPRFAETKDPEAAVEELVGLGWWDYPAIDDRYPKDDPDRDPGADPGLFRIVASMDDQPEPEVIEARRRKTAERVRQHRRKMAGLEPGEPDPRSNAVTERVTRDGSGRVLRTLPTLSQGLRVADPSRGLRSVDSIEESDGQILTPSQSRKRDHDGTDSSGSDDQQIPIEVRLQSQATDRNAREDGQP
jgi:hypothetical protein